MYAEGEGRLLVVVPDAGRPSSWWRAAFPAQTKRWAALGAARDSRLLALDGGRASAVLPDRGVELGTVRRGDRIVCRTAGGRIEVGDLGPA